MCSIVNTINPGWEMRMQNCRHTNVQTTIPIVQSTDSIVIATNRNIFRESISFSMNFLCHALITVTAAHRAQRARGTAAVVIVRRQW